MLKKKKKESGTLCCKFCLNLTLVVTTSPLLKVKARKELKEMRLWRGPNGRYGRRRKSELFQKREKAKRMRTRVHVGVRFKVTTKCFHLAVRGNMIIISS